MAATVVIKDFAADETAPEFNVGPDHFVCVPDIPLGIMQQVTKMRHFQDRIKNEETMDVVEEILSVFDELLTPPSAALFRECVKVKKTIGVRRLMAILPWIMEEFGLRPTQPSSPSSDGSNDEATGTSSEVGAPVSESIS